jgi:hypothetical protein
MHRMNGRVAGGREIAALPLRLRGLLACNLIFVLAWIRLPVICAQEIRAGLRSVKGLGWPNFATV